MSGQGNEMRIHWGLEAGKPKPIELNLVQASKVICKH